MKIEDIIQRHSEALDREVNDKPFLAQKLKNRLAENKKESAGRLRPLVLKPVILYLFLFIAFTSLGLWVIKGINPTEPPRKPSPSLAVMAEAVQPDYPGSISRAYNEVMK